MLQREMFDNETVGDSGASINNFVATANVEIMDRAGVNPNQKMLRLNHGSIATHKGRMINPNDATQEFVFTIKIPSGIDPTGNMIVDILDSAGSSVATIWIKDLKIGFEVGGAPIWSNQDVFQYERWEEVKLYIHNANADRPTNQVELLVNGYKLWSIAGAPDTLQNVATGTELTKITADAKISYYELRTFWSVFLDYWDFGGIITKEWADMSETTPLIPLVEFLLQGNDLATYRKLRRASSDINWRWIFNESDVGQATINTRNMNDFMDLQQDDESYLNFSLDNKARIFYQSGTLIYHGYKATSAFPVQSLTDANVNFDTLGVRVGDKLWVYGKDGTLKNPSTITGIIGGGTTLQLDQTIHSAVLSNLSYHIIRPSHVVFSSSLGDYVLKGTLKGVNFNWGASPNVTLSVYDEYYLTIQRPLICDSTRFYEKNIDDIYYGVNNFPNPPEHVIAPPTELGHYSGIMLQQKFNALTSALTNEQLTERPMTKVWDIDTSLYDAINSIAQSMSLEYQSYTDDEFRDDRIIIHRSRKDETDPALYDFHIGDTLYTETETIRSISSSIYRQGTDNKADYVAVIGSTDDKGIPIVANRPSNLIIDEETRMFILRDGNIRTQGLANDSAHASFNEYNRVVPEGSIDVGPFSLMETWYDGILTDENDTDTIYERITGRGFFAGDSDWFNNTITGSTLAEKDRTSQGHTWRKPINPIGEVGEYHRTNTESFKFIFNSLECNYNDGQGMLFSVEPNARPFEDVEFQQDTKRQIDFVAEQFRGDPNVVLCSALPLPEDFGQFNYVYGLTSAVLAPFGWTPGGAGTGVGRLVFDPFTYTDNIGVPLTPVLGYVFFESLTGVWGSWNILPAVSGVGPLDNWVFDIDNTSNSILFNTDPGGNYGVIAGRNFVDVGMIILGGVSRYILVILACRYTLATGVTHDIPRGTTVMNQTGIYYTDEENQIEKNTDGVLHAFP